MKNVFVLFDEDVLGYVTWGDPPYGDHSSVSFSAHLFGEEEAITKAANNTDLLPVNRNVAHALCHLDQIPAGDLASFVLQIPVWHEYVIRMQDGKTYAGYIGTDKIFRGFSSLEGATSSNPDNWVRFLDHRQALAAVNRARRRRLQEGQRADALARLKDALGKVRPFLTLPEDLKARRFEGAIVEWEKRGEI